jgi:membrane protease YdiL (CAAX protease family)
MLPDPKIPSDQIPVDQRQTAESSALGFQPESLSAKLTWGGWLSWGIIIFITLGMMGLPFIRTTANQEATKTKPPAASTFDRGQAELQGKSLFYPHYQAMEAAKKSNREPPESMLPAEMDEGTLSQRWSHTILLNEIDSPARALEHLELTRKRLQQAGLSMDQEQQQIDALLERIFELRAEGEFTSQALSEEDVSRLRREFGWFGDLLISADPENQALRQSVVQSARSTVLKMTFVVLGGLFILTLSLPVLAAFIIWSIWFRKGSQFRNQPSRHNLYIQTFALWMIIFFAGQLVLSLFLSAIQVNSPSQQLAWTLVPFVGSLIALAWPVFRGVPFHEVREDIGWKMKNPFLEFGIAIPAYWSILPFLFVGVLVVVLLSNLLFSASPTDFSGSNRISHPVQEFIAEGTPVKLALIFVLACIAAPIVEETMFRGVFYRHLRDLSSQWEKWLSIAFASLVNALIFAAIHPQGILGVPLLATLAIGFSIVREFRGSLIAPMVMHGINNLIAISVAFWIFA